jgi:hypothetical protein
MPSRLRFPNRSCRRSLTARSYGDRVRRVLALAAVLLGTSGSTASSGGEELIFFSSNRSQWRADHVFLYTPGVAAPRARGRDQPCLLT